MAEHQDGRGPAAPQDDRLRAETVLRAMHDITTRADKPFPDQARELLNATARQLGLAFGAVSRVDERKLTTRYVLCPNDEIAEGAAFDLCDTFCNEAVKAGKILSIHDVPNSDWKEHRAHTVVGFKSYIGIPISQDGRPWGTLCFFDFQTRERDFSSTDLDLITLVAERMQVGLEHEALMQTFRAVLDGTATSAGDGFFRNLVRTVGQSLGADIVVVSRCLDEHHSRAASLAVWQDGKPAENFEYDIAITPCAGLDQPEVLHYRDGLARLFPDDPGITERGLEGFVGVAARGSDGRVLGHLVAATRGPFEINTNERWMIEILAVRVGNEIERLRGEAEQQRLQQEMMHAEKLKSLGVLAGGIAHDFNNLLTGILGNASLALDDVEPSTEPHRRITQIERAAERAEQLTQQMLSYAGKVNFVASPIQLNDLVREMTELLETAISRTAEVHYEFEPTLPRLTGDSAQVQQILMNLMMNASDALEGRPGRITLRTGTCRIDEGGLRDYTVRDVLLPGRYAFVEVEDSGVGMESATSDRMFDPFFSTKFSGSGLGLSAVLGIVRMHGGGIRVRSTPGKGTVVRVVLPADGPKDSTAPALSTQSSAEEQLVGTALIVDDEQLVRDVAANILERRGMQVLCASDGLEGVELFRRKRDEIGVVLLDRTMPRLDGLSAARKIHEISPDTPLLLMSGFDQQAATRELDSRYLSGFVQTPFRILTLTDTVRAAMKQPGNGTVRPS